MARNATVTIPTADPHSVDEAQASYASTYWFVSKIIADQRLHSALSVHDNYKRCDMLVTEPAHISTRLFAEHLICM